MTGDPNLQRFLKDRYNELHDQGYSKSQAHAIAFQEMLQAKQQGYIEVVEQEPADPYLEVIYSDREGI